MLTCSRNVVHTYGTAYIQTLLSYIRVRSGRGRDFPPKNQAPQNRQTNWDHIHIYIYTYVNIHTGKIGNR